MLTIDPEEHELTALLERFPPVPGCRVVEVGCGDGRMTRRYAGRAGSVLAIDSDEAAIAAFRATGLDANVTARAVSILDLDLPDASADAVVFSWSL